MEIRYRSHEYYYFVGRILVDPIKSIRRVIQRMEDAHDVIYKLTNGYYGNAYCIYVMEEGSDNVETFHFRNFIEVIEKYGELDNNKPSATLTINNRSHGLKIHTDPHDARCMERDARGHHTIHLDIKPPPVQTTRWAKIYPETYCEKVMV